MDTMRVIYVHGISDSLPEKYDYTGGFSTRLVAKLKELGVIPARASQAEIDRIITFEPAYYADIGHDEEEALLKDYQRERGQLYNFFDQSLENLFGYDLIRRFMISSVSDVLLYKSEAGQNAIRERLLEKLVPYVGTPDPVTIVAHSLGSVVAFDVLYYHNWHTWRGLFKPANLFTLGSPIALFSLSVGSDGKQETKNNPKIAMPDPYLTQQSGVWYNFFDAQDIIGYHLESYFQNKYAVKDILVQTGTLPLKAHTEYWINNEILTTIAQRLKLDFERQKAKG